MEILGEQRRKMVRLSWIWFVWAIKFHCSADWIVKVRLLTNFKLISLGGGGGEFSVSAWVFFVRFLGCVCRCNPLWTFDESHFFVHMGFASFRSNSVKFSLFNYRNHRVILRFKFRSRTLPFFYKLEKLFFSPDMIEILCLSQSSRERTYNSCNEVQLVPI